MNEFSEQEQFWAGEFGDAYVDRMRGSQRAAAAIAFFAPILRHTPNIQSVLEFGPNIGLNLKALQHLLPEARLAGVEINAKAAAELKENLPHVDLTVGSILNFQPSETWDLVFTKGVLIHIDPGDLPAVYDRLHRAAGRFVLIAEYYSPQPTEVDYRGHSGKLFKRDFAGDLLNAYSDLQLVDYGFVYRHDPVFPQDDLTWFLLRKVGGNQP